MQHIRQFSGNFCVRNSLFIDIELLGVARFFGGHSSVRCRETGSCFCMDLSLLAKRKLLLACHFILRVIVAACPKLKIDQQATFRDVWTLLLFPNPNAAASARAFVAKVCNGVPKTGDCGCGLRWTWCVGSLAKPCLHAITSRCGHFGALPGTRLGFVATPGLVIWEYNIEPMLSHHVQNTRPDGANRRVPAAEVHAAAAKAMDKPVVQVPKNAECATGSSCNARSRLTKTWEHFAS